MIARFKKHKILLADEHKIIGIGLKHLLIPIFGRTHVYSVYSREGLLQILEEETFDLVISEIIFSDVAPFSLLASILKQHTNQKILVFSRYPEEIIGQRIKNLGIQGYLSKSTNDTEILSAVKTILNHKNYYQQFSISSTTNNSPFDSLSTRELEIMMLLLKGKSGLEITKLIQLKPSTVATYKKAGF